MLEANSFIVGLLYPAALNIAPIAGGILTFQFTLATLDKRSPKVSPLLYLFSLNCNIGSETPSRKAVTIHIKLCVKGITIGLPFTAFTNTIPLFL